MENTLENKAKFFCQYWMQNIVQDRLNSTDLCTVNFAISEDIYKEGWLLLKPLSSITDEDAKELSLRLGTVIGLDEIIHKNSPDLVKEVVENYSSINSLWMLPARFVDKARELGYAIDWNNLSVAKQIEYGWIKLKD